MNHKALSKESNSHFYQLMAQYSQEKSFAWNSGQAHYKSILLHYYLFPEEIHLRMDYDFMKSYLIEFKQSSDSNSQLFHLIRSFSEMTEEQLLQDLMNKMSLVGFIAYENGIENSPLSDANLVNAIFFIGDSINDDSLDHILSAWGYGWRKGKKQQCPNPSSNLDLIKETLVAKYGKPTDFTEVLSKSKYVQYEITFVDNSKVSVVMTDPQCNGLRCSKTFKDIKTIGGQGYRIEK